jgi:hypothetical protein
MCFPVNVQVVVWLKKAAGLLVANQCYWFINISLLRNSILRAERAAADLDLSENYVVIVDLLAICLHLLDLSSMK